MDRLQRTVAISIWLVACLAGHGCADYLSQGGQDGRQISLEGAVELADLDRAPLTRILFLIDTSTSMAVNDPDLQRMSATAEVVHRLNGLSTVKFGIVAFNGQASALTESDPYFTNRLALINEALAGLSQTSGSTSYDAALTLAYVAVQDEVNALSDHDRQRTHFHLIFLSDGLPYPQDPDSGSNTPASVSGLVDLLMAIQAEFSLAGMNLHTAYLAGAAPDEVRAEAAELLAEMASRGRGTYLEFDLADEINFNQLPLVDSLASQPPAHLLVLNLNMIMGPDGPLPDSDADGLDDSLEGALGLDPAHQDSDDDGYGDLVELLLGGGFDPGWGNPCYSRNDDDNDGLATCAEEMLGTDPFDADTDGDGLPDGVEIRVGSHPLRVESNQDLWHQTATRYWAEVVEEGWTRLEFRAEQVPLVPTTTGTNSLMVWADSSPGNLLMVPGRFQATCLVVEQPFDRLPDTLLLDSSDFASAGLTNWRPGGGCLPAEP